MSKPPLFSAHCVNSNNGSAVSRHCKEVGYPSCCHNYGKTIANDLVPSASGLRNAVNAVLVTLDLPKRGVLNIHGRSGVPVLYKSDTK